MTRTRRQTAQNDSQEVEDERLSQTTKKPRKMTATTTTTAAYAIEKLATQLEEWVLHPHDHVEQLNSVLAAAKAVSLAVQPEQGQGFSYETTLNEWFAWKEKAVKAYSSESGNNNDRARRTARRTLRRAALAQADRVAKQPEQMQLAKLNPMTSYPHEHLELLESLKELLPTKSMRDWSEDKIRTQAKKLAKKLYEFVEDDQGRQSKFSFQMVDPMSGVFSRNKAGAGGEKGFAELISKLWVAAKKGQRAITLSLRVRRETQLHELCEALDKNYAMTDTICPASQWEFGTPEQQAAVEQSEADEASRTYRLPADNDKRYYVIVGAPGAITKSHVDRGVQAVLYHTVAGTNHVLAVPSKVALMLDAIDSGMDMDSSNWTHELELETLQRCKSVLRTGTFTQGETMLILPGGGHAVLTGAEGKVVLAGEWHLRTGDV